MKILISLFLSIFLCDFTFANDTTDTGSNEASPIASPTNGNSFTLVKSSEWRTRKTQPIKGRLKGYEHKPKFITVHHSAVRKKKPAKSMKGRKNHLKKKMKSLYNFSTRKKTKYKKKLWGDVPYHFIMGPAGVVAEGRSPRLKPDTNTKFKTAGHINIVVNGAYHTKDGKKRIKNPNVLSGGQKKALIALIKSLQKQYGIPNSRVGTHKNHARTICPGENIQKFIDQSF